MNKQKITSATITTVDLAGRYKSTAGSQGVVDPAIIASAMEVLNRDGYICKVNMQNKWAE